jgi:predicted signal transduction protein with EAL and GGDEF domain
MPRVPANPDARTQLEKRVRRRLLDIADVQEGDAVFGDRTRTTAFFVDGTQMANFVGENTLGIRLMRSTISRLRVTLKADDRVTIPRPGGDWIAVVFPTSADIDFVVELAAVAADAHRPAGGPIRPPPSGPDLARRQGFH